MLCETLNWRAYGLHIGLLQSVQVVAEEDEHLSVPAVNLFSSFYYLHVAHDPLSAHGCGSESIFSTACKTGKVEGALTKLWNHHLSTIFRSVLSNMSGYSLEVQQGSLGYTNPLQVM